ncbi:unnamed protein product, partial [Meganyctiphanes norvegica]
WNNCFVLNLCLTAVLAAALVLPLSMLAFARRPEELSPGLCILAHFFHSTVVNVTIWTTCLISIDRHFMILLPMIHAAEVTLFRALVAVLVVWLLAVLPAGYLTLQASPDNGYQLCCSWGLGVASPSAGYVLTILLVEFLLPALTITAMYGAIFRVARRAVQSVSPAGRSVPSISASIDKLQLQGSDVTLAVKGIIGQVAWTTPSLSSINKTTNDSTNYMFTSTNNAETYIKTKADKRRSNSVPVGGASGEGQSSKAAKTLMVVVGSFWLLCAPYFFYNTYLALAHLNVHSHEKQYDSELETVVQNILDDLEDLDSTVNTVSKSSSVGAIERLADIREELQDSLHVITKITNTSKPTCPCDLEKLDGGRDSHVLQAGAHITEWLLYLCLALNPFLYGVLNRAIRTQLKKILSSITSQCGWRWWTRRSKVSPNSVGVEENQGSCEDPNGGNQGAMENILEFLERTNYPAPQSVSLGQM